jgi:hypothetical protein
MSVAQQWRHCEKCHGAVPDSQEDTKGPSTAGGDEASKLVRQLDAPAVIDINWPSIVFSGGVAVGGFAHLTIRSDGSFTFSGHFHDSGAIAYHMVLAWAVKDSRNVVYRFTFQGEVFGTFEKGSRDINWSVTQFNQQLAQNWANIAASWTARAEASASLSLGPLWDSIINALGTALTVVSIIAVG